MNIEEKLTTSIISAIKTLYGTGCTRKNGTTAKELKKEFERTSYFGCFPFSENV